MARALRQGILGVNPAAPINGAGKRATSAPLEASMLARRLEPLALQERPFTSPDAAGLFVGMHGDKAVERALQRFEEQGAHSIGTRSQFGALSGSFVSSWTASESVAEGVEGGVGLGLSLDGSALNAGATATSAASKVQAPPATAAMRETYPLLFPAVQLDEQKRPASQQSAPTFE